jgi:putative transposase
LLSIFALATPDDLRQQLQYLKAENEILRSKIRGPIRVTNEERTRLLKLGIPLGTRLKSLISVVKPDTFARWVREARGRKKKKAAHPQGRPRTAEEVREVVLRIARETGWGYTRILGELRKLGIHVSRGTVVNILKEAKLPTGPSRSESSWSTFVKRHAKTLWACDFLQIPIITPRGIKDAFVLVFIHVESRRTYVSPSTLHPDAAWVAHQVEGFAEATEEGGFGTSDCRVMTRDNDTKFGVAFDTALKDSGIRPVRLPHCSPNLNAHVERVIQSIQVECLEKFIVMGKRHLDYLIHEYITHYNTERPHSGIGYRRPGQVRFTVDPPANAPLQVKCKARLAGVLRHYYRRTG